MELLIEMDPRVVDDAWHRFTVDLALFLPRAVSALAVFVAFWAAGVFAAGVLSRIGRARQLDGDLTRLLARAGRGTLAAFGLVTALGTLGIDVKALVAGLGLTGFALGFALRDIIANTLAGILILIYKPFRRGDRISITGSDGVIAQIDLRYTVLDVNETTSILIPNSTLLTNIITVSRGRPGSG